VEQPCEEPLIKTLTKASGFFDDSVTTPVILNALQLRMMEKRKRSNVVFFNIFLFCYLGFVIFEKMKNQFVCPPP
jgi:hypothetical protein